MENLNFMSAVVYMKYQELNDNTIFKQFWSLHTLKMFKLQRKHCHWRVLEQNNRRPQLFNKNGILKNKAFEKEEEEENEEREEEVVK